MKKFHLMTTAAVATALLAISPTAMANNTTANDFVKNAAIGSEFEVESSKLALEKSQNSDIKAFAQQMIDDHTKAGEKLKDTLSSTKVDPTLAETPLDSKHQKKLDELKSATGKDFDKEYVDTQKDAHDDAVKLFKDYSKKGDDAALKQFASDTLPTLEQHKDHVKKLK